MCPAPIRPQRPGLSIPVGAPEPKRPPERGPSLQPPDGFAPVKGGPFSVLAAMGRFDSYVTTASGVDVYVRVRPGRNAANTAPLVFLDGLNGAASRSKRLDALVDTHGITLVSLSLVGQGETLNRDLERTGGRSVQADIDPAAQAKLVLETLDALGARAPVDVAGLSYGGGIAALVKHLAPDRVSRLLLAAPYTVSAMQHDPVRAAMGALLNDNPFNPLGPALYRATVRATLAATVPPPEPIKSSAQRIAFAEAVYRLTMGMESFELGKALKGARDVHLLTVPLDPIVPPALAERQARAAEHVTVTSAGAFSTLAHDLIDRRPSTLVEWLAKTLSAPSGA
ncbi:MAG: alpha/beta hydrolase [Myxococcaceae bacterium]|nr:alpha/beta hydrolase [Myxococcaceae bacterium]